MEADDTTRGETSEDQLVDGPHTLQYEIVVAGEVDQRWADWFDGLTLGHPGDGTTVLRGPVADQAALHGVLAKLRDLGLALVAVSAGSAGTPDTSGAPDRPAVPTDEPHGSPTQRNRHAQ